MVRRIIDILFALLWLMLTCPILFVLAILIRLEAPGPIFYRQRMVGWHGNIFSLLRFRTMYVDTQKGFTHTGRFIRNYSLDHLPQLINLFKGDITLIGPRPMEANIVDLQERVWQEYVQEKPGLFNYAVYKLGKQWTPRRSSDPHLNQQLELEYRQHRTGKSDLRLFLVSIQKLVSSKGNIKARGTVDPELEQRLKDNG